MPDLEADDRKLVTLARSSRARIQAAEGAAVDGKATASGRAAASSEVASQGEDGAGSAP